MGFRIEYMTPVRGIFTRIGDLSGNGVRLNLCKEGIDAVFVIFGIFAEPEVKTAFCLVVCPYLRNTKGVFYPLNNGIFVYGFGNRNHSVKSCVKAHDSSFQKATRDGLSRVANSSGDRRSPIQRSLFFFLTCRKMKPPMMIATSTITMITFGVILKPPPSTYGASLRQ